MKQINRCLTAGILFLLAFSSAGVCLDIDTSSYDYTVVGECVYNIFTSGTGEILSGRITSSAGSPLLGVTVTATARRYNQQTTTNENGIYAFLNVPSETTFTISAAKTNWTFSNPQSAATTTSQDWSSASGNGWGIDFTGSPTNISSEDFDLSGYVDVDDLMRDVGFKPSTSIEEGIGKFVDWYKEYYGY